MRIEILFPSVICILFALAGLVYLKEARPNEALYSFAAAFLNFVVYFRPF